MTDCAEDGEEEEEKEGDLLVMVVLLPKSGEDDGKGDVDTAAVDAHDACSDRSSSHSSINAIDSSRSTKASRAAVGTMSLPFCAIISDAAILAAVRADCIWLPPCAPCDIDEEDEDKDASDVVDDLALFIPAIAALCTRECDENDAVNVGDSSETGTSDCREVLMDDLRPDIVSPLGIFPEGTEEEEEDDDDDDEDDDDNDRSDERDDDGFIDPEVCGALGMRNELPCFEPRSLVSSSALVLGTMVSAPALSRGVSLL